MPEGPRTKRPERIVPPCACGLVDAVLHAAAHHSEESFLVFNQRELDLEHLPEIELAFWTSQSVSPHVHPAANGGMLLIVARVASRKAADGRRVRTENSEP